MFTIFIYRVIVLCLCSEERRLYGNDKRTEIGFNNRGHTPLNIKKCFLFQPLLYIMLKFQEDCCSRLSGNGK